MSKYLVNAKRTASGSIAHLQVYSDSKWQAWTRSSVIASIDRGNTFVTFIQRNGKWVEGAEIHKVIGVGGPYLRTDPDGSGADNLGSLPEF